MDENFVLLFVVAHGLVRNVLPDLPGTGHMCK